jgi:DhnA family fructose-bisphosphate aldolase class Ia
MSIGKKIRLNRIFSHPGGRLCPVAIDHFIGYGKLTSGGGLSNLPAALKKIVAGMPGAVASFRQIVESSPVPVIAGGGPKAKNLLEALNATASVVEAGGRGATIGRNVWGVEPVSAAFKSFKAVILDGISPEKALAENGLTGQE